MVALGSSLIRKMLLSGELKVEGANKGYINPASLNIPLINGEVFSSSVIFNNLNKKTMKKFASKRGVLEDMVFEKNKLYVVEGPHIKMPDDFEGIIDARSTVGRLGIKVDVPLLADDGEFSMINKIPAGFSGRLFFRIEPQLPLRFRKGDALVQIRLREKNSSNLNCDQLSALYKKSFAFYGSGDKPLSQNKVLYEDGTVFTVDTSRIVRLKKEIEEPVDFWRKGHYEPEDYWEIIRNKESNGFVLEKDRLYLLSTKERVDTGNDLCWKLMPMTDFFSRFVETHRAGFVDPGFNATLTLEILNHHLDMEVVDGQVISVAHWEFVHGCDSPYHGSYQSQLSPALPKQFKDHDKIWEND